MLRIASLLIIISGFASSSLLSESLKWPIPGTSFIPLEGFVYEQLAFSVKKDKLLSIRLEKDSPKAEVVYEYDDSQLLPKVKKLRNGYLVSSITARRNLINLVYLKADGTPFDDREIEFDGFKVYQYSIVLDKYGEPAVLAYSKGSKGSSLLLKRKNSIKKLLTPGGKVINVYLSPGAREAHCLFSQNDKTYWFIQAPGGAIQGHIPEQYEQLIFFPDVKGLQVLGWNNITGQFRVFYWDNKTLKEQPLYAEKSGFPDSLTWVMRKKAIAFLFYDSKARRIKEFLYSESKVVQVNSKISSPVGGQIIPLENNILIQDEKSDNVYYVDAKEQCILEDLDFSYKRGTLQIQLKFDAKKVTALQYLIDESKVTEPIPPDRPVAKKLTFEKIAPLDQYFHVKLFCGKKSKLFHFNLPLRAGLENPEFVELKTGVINKLKRGVLRLTPKNGDNDQLVYSFARSSRKRTVNKRNGKYQIPPQNTQGVMELTVQLIDRASGLSSSPEKFTVEFLASDSAADKLNLLDDKLDHSRSSVKQLKRILRDIEKLEKNSMQ